MFSKLIKKYVWIWLLLPVFAFAQGETKDLVGEVSRVQLQNDPFFGPVFMEEYRGYAVNEDVVAGLKTYIYEYNITIVMGTWCGDSQEQVPHFIKILDKLDYDTRKLHIIAVDHQKEAAGTGVEKLDVQRVPTFIFYDENAREVGRIVETPHETLEQDMYDIVNK